MPQNFIAFDRDQELLLPPDLRDWLPQDHLAWFVLAAVGEMDLGAFYRPYSADGVGRPAHDPQVMVALLLYAYCRGQRSARVIERECVEDVAYRVIAANQCPGQTTIARFRQRHEDAIAGLFGEVLVLCADAGLAGVGVLAVDGTKVHANARTMRTVTTSSLLARSSRRPRRSTGARTSSTGTAAVMSCRRSSRRSRVAVAGCARPSSVLRRSARRTRSRCRGRVRRG
jgi:transposase